MLVLLSPAKTLDFETPLQRPAASREFSAPDLLQDSEQLIRTLRMLSPEDLSELMDISPALAELNYRRFANWQTPFTKDNARPALFAFTGDVYMGLEAGTLTAGDLNFAQDRIRILSGLYGVLKPLDLVQPYRLEMGRPVHHEKTRSLYEFWADRITARLNEQLQHLKSETVINLASVEYYRSVQERTLNAKVINPVFRDYKNGQYKIISFFAKKARGMMAGYIVRNRVKTVKALRKFTQDGYQYSDIESSPDQPVFLRRAS